MCHNDERGSRVWRELIHQHVGMVLRTMDAPSALETLPAEQIRPQPYPRVVGAEGLDPRKFAYARAVAPGLHEILALDLPESVMMLTDEALEPLGDLPYLRDQALYDLRGLPVEAYETVMDSEGLRFEVVLGDSFYTASRVLALVTLVRQVTGEELTADGALVAMPFRHQLAFHATGMLPPPPTRWRLRRHGVRGHARRHQPVRLLVARRHPHPAERPQRGRRRAADRDRRGVPRAP
ncbi:hypothetical protein [Streptomyces sp. NPDC057426]|uniref:hypothetical protein n=1 Tax=Streptomyces sp. NPDC057426 TaxID=3346128 RepID=UPI003679CBCD